MWKDTITQINSWEDKVRVTSKDSGNREALNTIFWDWIIASRVPSLSAQFQYWLASDQASTTLVNGWTVETDDSMLKAKTAALTNSSAVVQSNEYLRYLPGHEWYAMMTVVFSEPKIWSVQKAWLFDWTDGFAFGFVDTQFSFFLYRKWVVQTMDIEFDPIFEDELFDPTAWNIYRISFAYLWFWPISLEVACPDWWWELAARFTYPNSSTVTHIAQTHLPLRAEIENTTNDTIMEMSSWSLTAWIIDWNIVPGWATDPSARLFTKRATIGSWTSWSIIAFQNKTTYTLISNRVWALLKLISASSDWNKSVAWRLLKNPSISNTPTWTDVHADSVLQFSEDVILTAWAEDWESFLDWDMAKIDTFFEDVAWQNLILPPWWIAVFYFESSVSTEVALSIRWAELF